MPSDKSAEPRTRVGGGISAWLASLGLALCGDEVFILALTWAALRVGSAAEVGAVVAAASIPRIAVLLVGGAFADRFRPRRIALLAGTGRAVVMAIAAVAVFVSDTQIWHLVVVGLAIGLADGFFSPAIGALPTTLAPPESMPRLAGLRVVVQRMVLLLAGPMTGAVIALSGWVAAFFLTAVLFALSVVTLLIARPRTDPSTVPSDVDAETVPHTSFWREVLDGVLLVRSRPLLRWLLVMISAMNLGFAGPFTVGLPLLAASTGWGPEGSGILVGVFGAGAAATGLGLAFARRVPAAGLLVLGSIVVQGLSIAAFAVVGSFPAAVVAAIFMGLAAGAVGAVIHALLLMIMPLTEIGRVMALLAITLEGSFPISVALVGIAFRAGFTNGAFVVGGLLLLVAAAGAATRPDIRHLTLVRPAS